MKTAHFIELRVFCKEEDNEESITQKIYELFPFDFKKEKIELKSRNFIGDNDKIIKIITILGKKERHTRKILENLSKHLTSEQKELLLEQLESRLDHNLHFFIRLEKDNLLKGEYVITEGGNCFHLKIAVAAYPHKRDVAKNIVRSWLEN
ncbi:MAG: RNA-binding domain-containing protein [archaeon]